MRNTISIILGILFILSCKWKSPQSEIDFDSFFSADALLSEEIDADSLFFGSCPVFQDKEEYVYLVNTECSYCISKALSCYRLYKKSNSEKHFLFISRSDDNDLFIYYFQQQNSGMPKLYMCERPVDFEDGLFRIDKGLVNAFIMWK